MLAWPVSNASGIWPTGSRNSITEQDEQASCSLAARRLIPRTAGISAPHPGALAIAALVAFVVSIGASVFILMPKENLIFSEAGAGRG